MTRRRIPKQKQRHEIAKYLNWLETFIYGFTDRVGAVVGALTREVTDEAFGYLSLPSRQVFEKLTGFTAPTGMIFPDGSFFVFKETIRFGSGVRPIRNRRSTEPSIATSINVRRIGSTSGSTITP